ncbi:hypothetical protein QW060_22475 [Myroides ceti]|uniref:Uncharacterized protein n=1 Tax=Paenimyroides ceti TaxID=395087 RepID=A0ABT8CYR6_9FLAO|nr:hypothetical protein [Paenimyroides ceti]MDN3709715.1 hypothetical protein [Paenimyroides ceti]
MSLRLKNWRPAKRIYKNSFPVINIRMASGLLEAGCSASLYAAMPFGRPSRKSN